jgi:UDP-N-acetylmuramoylalanine--D-glutamate ligase
LDGTKTFRPHIGILLNITPDHLDRYNYEMQNYVNSKFQLIQSMQAEDHFIYFTDDQVIGAEISKRKIGCNTYKVSLTDASADAHFDGRVMFFDLGHNLFSISQQETTLKGPHNLINTMAAVTAVYTAGVSMESIKAGLKTFKNAPHRLESVATINGVEFVNDSKATNVDSVVYALGSYHGPLVWIAGGIDKGNDYKLLEEQVRKKVKVLICLGKDNSKLFDAFDGVVRVICETQNMKETIDLAYKVARPGDVVLLSPACASFDLFKNYEDRGNQFREATLELKKNWKKFINRKEEL